MNFAARASPWQREYDDENGQRSRPPLVSSIWHLGLSLSGVETQDLRRLIKRCYLCLNAIHDPKSPALLETVLPLAFQSSSVLHGLLALSKASKSRSETDLSRHQMALGQLVAEIGASNPGPIDAIHAQRALASSLLLSIFAVGSCDGSWCHHVRGMVSILRSTDRASLTSQPTGRFLVGICAFSDISALSVGRRRLSQKAWLSWMTPRPSQDCDSASASASASFSALESTVGYPESLIDLLAQAAERADDNVHAHPKFSNSASSPASGLDTLGYPWSSQELEASLKSWSPPELPRHMSSYEQLAVRTFWSAIRKACLLFLWRGRGFHSNLAERQPGGRSAESQGRSAESQGLDTAAIYCDCYDVAISSRWCRKLPCDKTGSVRGLGLAAGISRAVLYEPGLAIIQCPFTALGSHFPVRVTVHELGDDLAHAVEGYLRFT
ncbi:fungal-specific transcription factor domain-containing protein [Fusarium globosum]|uniref:Fungal-specific transcription factor domain-containing protein n=1 Tax=Fusarium globosum TaxID=78864 RepID=A0A8H5XWK4_9HYPO|nr:fungal-specific transcription factor domain-containing protein [Fusarium globosum]